MSANQRGFNVLYGLLALIVVVAVTLVGWHIWQINVPKPSEALTVYTDTAHVFTLNYPASWKLTYPDTGGDQGAPDWTKQSRPLTLTPPNAPPQSLGVQISMLSRDMGQQLIAQHQADKAHTVTKLNINSIDAYNDKLVFVGPSSVEKYTDDNYIILHGGYALLLAFRESYYHNYPAENWNDSNDLGAFTDIAHSVKFL